MLNLLQDSKECYITGATFNLHKHHIFMGNAQRAISEKYGCWVWLRADYHNQSEYGVHGRDGHDLDIYLKSECQKAFEKIYGHQLFMQLFKRNYI